jgi:putative tryptophan/tyrosine transport system ATP-binding protein
MIPHLSLKKICLFIHGKERPILEKVSLEIYPNDFVILLGSNGSGKSSLIKVINGLSKPTSGAISLEDTDITDQPIHKRAQSIITLTQDLNLSTFSQLTVLENCLIALYRNKRVSLAVSVKKKREQISDYLAIYSDKLAQALDEPVTSLSGGQRQTLALAMSLYNNPSLLLLDEHTSALDPMMATKLMALTSKITQEQAITTLMTTHNLNDALCYGNRLIVMRHGQLLHDFNEEEKKALTRTDLMNFYEPLQKPT